MNKSKIGEKDKKEVYFRMGFGVFVFSLLFLFSLFLIIKNGFQPDSIIIFLIASILAFLFIIKGIKQLKDIKEGFPLRDERSNKIIILAASKAFHISLFCVLGLMWSENIINLTNFGLDFIFAIIVGGMGLIFGLCWLYYNNQENLII